ncbi:MAG: DUF4124 domain-containing protein [Proteobacteria bacterium]|nr:DUF4124 domain-containing protein [Pseudomonadota bacterium]
MSKLLLAILMLGFISTALAQKVYKWVDEDGNVHYSSQKPATGDVERIKLDSAPKYDPADDKPVDTSAAEEKQDAADEKQAKKQLAASDKATNKKLCSQAKANQNALNATPRIRQIDEKTGEVFQLSDDQRAQSLKQANQFVRDYCK